MALLILRVSNHHTLHAIRGDSPMDRQYIGIDLHKASFQACALRADGARLWEARLHRTAEGIAWATRAACRERERPFINA